MMAVLIISVVTSVVVSALCSLMEAALYSVPMPHVKHLAESGSKTGEALYKLKEDVGKPISAILILNTIANTAGASVAGWAVGQIYGQQILAVFSACFILTILYVSEIIPKTAGVVYAKSVAPLIAYPLRALVVAFTPLIILSEIIAGFIRRGDSDTPTVSEQEVLSMAEMGTEEGTLDRFEGSVIKNVIGLDSLFVRDVLTPRVVVFRLDEELQLGEIEEDIADWNFSRVPTYSAEDPDHLTGYVTQRDIFRDLLADNKEKQLKEVAREIPTVPELMSVDQLLLQMFEKRWQMCGVVDEHGGLAGIITLEDIIEEVVGREIVDEYDTVSDLRTFAKILRFARGSKKKK